MCRFLPPLFALVLLLFTTSAFAEKPKEGKIKKVDIPGVTGHFIRIPLNKDNAGKAEQFKIKAGTTIQIEWTYPIVPTFFPKSAKGESSDSAVKFIEIDTLEVRPSLLGVGRLGAFFKAEKKGMATLTFSIKFDSKDLSTDGGVILKAEVEVE